MKTLPLDPLNLPEWLIAYAARACAGMKLGVNDKLKGRGHLPRIELDFGQRLNALTRHLPPITIQKRDDIPHWNQEQHKNIYGYHKVRCALVAHYTTLCEHLCAAGFDLERMEIVNRKAFAFAASWWALNRELLPAELQARQRAATTRAVEQREARETAEIYHRTRS